MRTLKILALATLLLSPLARAQSPELFQIKARQATKVESTWQNFWAGLLGQRAAADLTVRVLDSDGDPLAGAKVLVGQQSGNPFVGNELVTGSDGLALFSDEALRSGAALAVTASLAGYSTLSLAANRENDVELRLAKIPAERDFSFFRGKVNGFPAGIGGGQLELGLFLPAFRPESLLNFDPQQFVSSFEVKVDVYGEQDIPGNVVFPTQRKRWGIIPISISKPDYIMPLPRGLEAHMLALAGSVDISDAVKLIRKKDALGIINIARFTHLGSTNRPVEVRGDESFNLNLSQELAPGAVTAQVSGVPAGLDAISVSFYDKAGDRSDFLPMDVKAVKAADIKNGNTSLKVGVLKQRRSQDRFYVFTGLLDHATIDDKNAPSRAIVASLQPVSGQGSRFAGFLRPLRSLGVGQRNREFRFSPAANGKLVPDFVLLNIVSEKKNALTQGTTRSLLWSVVLPGAAESVVLPELGRPVLPSPDPSKEERFFWEVVAVKASSSAAGADLDIQSALRNLSHVSSLSQKF